MIQPTEDTPGKSWVYRLPIPQTKIILGCVLGAGTFFVVWVAILAGRVVNVEVLTILLGFCLAVLGISAWDYHTKRNTDIDVTAVRQGLDPRTFERPARKLDLDPAPAPVDEEHRWQGRANPTEGLG